MFYCYITRFKKINERKYKRTRKNGQSKPEVKKSVVLAI
jgi:hypothetical protein